MDVNRYPRGSFYLPPERSDGRSRLSDQLIVIMQAEIDLLRCRRLGGREAWRNYEIAARELKIIVAIKDTPPPGWADDLYSDDYVPPPEGWPGQAPTIPLKDLVVARKGRQDRLCPESADKVLDLVPVVPRATGNGKTNADDESSDAS